MCRILVVDDDPAVGALLSRILKSFDVKVVQEYAEAQWAIKEFRPSIAFLDLYLGERDGRNLLGIISKNTPVIAITGSKPDEEVVCKLMEAGAVAVIRKPFTTRMILALTNRLYTLLDLDKDLTEYSVRLAEATGRLKEARAMLKKQPA